MNKEYGTTCLIEVLARDPLSVGKAKFCLNTTQNKIDTTAFISYEDNCLEIRGSGFDGRCSFCRYFRLNLKRQQVEVRVDCPFEISTPGAEGRCSVSIGNRLFDQGYLEDEGNLKRAAELARNNPQDVESHLVVGVISEYQGHFTDALGAYWKAYELDNQNSFARTRLREILEFLIEILPES